MNKQEQEKVAQLHSQSQADHATACSTEAFQALARKNQYLALLHETAVSLMNRLDVGGVLEGIIYRAAHLLRTEHAYVQLVNQELDALVTEYGIGVYANRMYRQVRYGEGVSGRVWESGERKIINHYNDWEGRLDDGSEPEVQTVLCFPLKSAHMVTGVFGLAVSDPDYQVAPEELDVLQQFAVLASIALDNAMMHTAVEKELMVRKWVEEALQASEVRYKGLMDNLSVGVTLLNKEMEVISANRQFLQWFPDTGIGKKTHCLLPIEHNTAQQCSLSPGQETFRTAMTNETVMDFNVDGVQRYFRVVASPIKDNRGEVQEVIQMIEDITEKRRNEAELLKLSSAVAQSPSSVIIADTDGLMEYANQKYYQLTGFRAENILGKAVPCLEAVDMQVDDYDDVWKGIRSGEEWRGELHSQKANGEWYWALASISPIRNSHGVITHIVIVQEDITLRKQMEEELRLKNVELQDTLEKLSYTQMQLFQQEKLAGIGTLAAGVAHEINNPLGFVISNFRSLNKYVQSLQDIFTTYHLVQTEMQEAAEPKVQAWLQTMQDVEKAKKLSFILEDLQELLNESNDGLERVSKIIKELRSFSRVDRQDQWEEYELNKGIESSLLMARNEIKYYAEVQMELAEIPNVQAIGGAINQVLVNILVNAAQAIKRKSADALGQITIKTYSDADSVFCEIKDSGEGIAEEDITKIFEPFFTTKPVGEGTGLGLSISYDIIVNRHKGDIKVESELGVGTTFILRLPRLQSNPVEDEG